MEIKPFVLKKMSENFDNLNFELVISILLFFKFHLTHYTETILFNLSSLDFKKIYLQDFSFSAESDNILIFCDPSKRGMMFPKSKELQTILEKCVVTTTNSSLPFYIVNQNTIIRLRYTMDIIRFFKTQSDVQQMGDAVLLMFTQVINSIKDPLNLDVNLSLFRSQELDGKKWFDIVEHRLL
jgi:hypothetical protein